MTATRLLVCYAAVCAIALMAACYDSTTPLPPCSASDTACAGYPGITVTESKRDGGTVGR
jgi:hypothetical protein